MGWTQLEGPATEGLLVKTVQVGQRSPTRRESHGGAGQNPKHIDLMADPIS